jgi:hypothetical protein
MTKQEQSGLRARIPAAIAATVQQAARLLDRASQAVPMRRAKNPGNPPASPPPGNAEPRSRDDTH